MGLQNNGGEKQEKRKKAAILIWIQYEFFEVFFWNEMKWDETK